MSHSSSVHATRAKSEPNRRGAKGEFTALKESWLFEFVQSGSQRHGGTRGGHRSRASIRSALEHLGATPDLRDALAGKRRIVAPLISVLQPQPERPKTVREAKLAEWENVQQKRYTDRAKFIVPGDLRTLTDWVNRGQAGTWALYWEGYLAYDVGTESREKGGRNGDYPAPNVQVILWRAYKGGRVELYQKRIGPGHFRYWAKRVNDLPTAYRRIPAAKAPSTE